QMFGGTGVDGATTLLFAEKIELGGALVLQHGNFAFSAASNGVLGGLYPSAISIAGCLAGFRITPNGTQSTIRALVNGNLAGPSINTVAGHRYAFTTRLYASEVYRKQQTFHSAAHPAASGAGGGSISGDVRVVLEVHDVDPANPKTLIDPSIVLYDGVLQNASGFCAYALVNAGDLHCSAAFTRISQVINAEVRSAAPGESYRTRLVGSALDGAECGISSSAVLQFYPDYVPVLQELIEVRYRAGGRAMARVL